MKPKKPKTPKAAAAPPAAGSPFPDPAQRRRPRADRLHRTRADCAIVGADCIVHYIVSSRQSAPCFDGGLPQRQGVLNDRTLMSLPTIAVPSDDRPVRPDHQLFAGVGHRSLRPALLLLHVRRHDVPAQGRSAHAGGTRPAVFGLHRQGRAQAAADRRRTAGPAQRDVAGALAVAPSRHRRARRTDADHQRLAAGALCRANCATAACAASTCRWTRSIRRNSAPSPAGAISTRCWPASRPRDRRVSPSRSTRWR